MNRAPDMRSPAPRANADRAEVIRCNSLTSIIAGPEPEATFAALYVARRFRLPLPLAQAVAMLAGLGRAFG